MKSFQFDLRAALKERKITQSELARMVGIGSCSISEYVRGEAIPRRETLRKINEALGVSLSTARPITTREVAWYLGIGPSTLMRGMRAGKFAEIGQAVPTESGNGYRYVFYPAKLKEYIGID